MPFIRNIVSSGEAVRQGHADRWKAVTWIFSCIKKKRIHSKNKKKSKQGKKTLPLTFYFPSVLSSHKVIINFCWTRKWSSLRAIFINPKREKKMYLPFLLPSFSLFLSLLNYGLRSLAGSLQLWWESSVRVKSRKNESLTTGSIYKEKSFKKHTVFLIHADHKPKNINHLPVIWLDISHKFFFVC